MRLSMEYLQRITALRTVMLKKKLDAFVSFHVPSVRYLTGFSGSNSLLVVTDSETFFMTDFRYEEQIRTEVTADHKNILTGNLLNSGKLRKIFSTRKKIGFEEEHVSVRQYADLKKAASGKKITGTSGIVEALRAVKDRDEIALIEKAVGITDTVFQKILGRIKPGISESELAAEISYQHKMLGAESDAFESIVASGYRGALPHGRATLKKIQSGEFVTLDFGCVYQGYYSDMTRTVCVGSPTSEMKKVYAVVLEAQKRAIGFMNASAGGKNIDSVARKYIASQGYGNYFGHGLGHGVGLEIHESLRLSQQSKDTLRIGNVVTVEPGIYLPKKFGVRIEDIVVVRERGCEVLTSSPKELICL
jgi:Xaa-Pro aminopeptidase